MNRPKVEPESYLQFLIASPRQVTCTEAAVVQPAQPDPPAHDAFRRLPTRLEPDPDTLWQEARPQIRPGEGWGCWTTPPWTNRTPAPSSWSTRTGPANIRRSSRASTC